MVVVWWCVVVVLCGVVCGGGYEATPLHAKMLAIRKLEKAYSLAGNMHVCVRGPHSTVLWRRNDDDADGDDDVDDC